MRSFRKNARHFARLALAAVAIGAGTAHARVINHDAVAPMPTNPDYSLDVKFQPLLKVKHGCVPFPAVNAAGDVSGGLKPTGSHNGDCGKSRGQVYSRAVYHRGKCAIMYAWYMPKDLVIAGQGHRHDWENIVVWLPECNINARVEAVSYSAHGNYRKTRSPGMRGNAPLVKYDTNLITNHDLNNTTEVGGSQPLAAWFDNLTPAARNTLNTYNFGAATVPLKDSTFYGNLDKAYPF